MSKDKILIIGIIAIILIITISVLAVLIIFTGKDNTDEMVDKIEDIEEGNNNPEDKEKEVFVSTDEHPYDTSEIDKIEKEKDGIGKEDLKAVREIIVPWIAIGEWDKALDYINNYFEENSYQSEEGEILQSYQNDLNVMIQMSGVPEDTYDELFKSFEAPETFLACMIYYPPSVKMSGFLSAYSLVPTTERNDVVFYELKDSDDEKMLEDLNKSFNDEYEKMLSQEFDLDGKRYIAYIAKKKDGTYMMYNIEAISVGSYFMTVDKWRINLNYKMK